MKRQLEWWRIECGEHEFDALALGPGEAFRKLLRHKESGFGILARFCMLPKGTKGQTLSKWHYVTPQSLGRMKWPQPYTKYAGAT